MAMRYKGLLLAPAVGKDVMCAWCCQEKCFARNFILEVKKYYIYLDIYEVSYM